MRTFDVDGEYRHKISPGAAQRCSIAAGISSRAFPDVKASVSWNSWKYRSTRSSSLMRVQIQLATPRYGLLGLYAGADKALVSSLPFDGSSL